MEFKTLEITEFINLIKETNITNKNKIIEILQMIETETLQMIDPYRYVQFNASNPTDIIYWGFKHRSTDNFATILEAVVSQLEAIKKK